MRTIQREIAGAFIFSKDGLILLGKTGKGGVYQDTWVVPGGGINDGETNIQAVKREIQEELGLIIADDQIEILLEPSTGVSNKILKDTGEEVTVEMTFWDFKVKLPGTAEETKLSLDDDLAEARFFNIDELSNIKLGEGTFNSLKKMGLLS